MRRLFFMAICMGLTPALSQAQTQPDISAIGDFRAFTGNWKDATGAKTPRNGNLNMQFHELEVIIAGYLNPFARTWVTVSTPGDGLEIEEAYATIFKGLPLNAELRAGQWLVDFGKLNASHTHAYSFIDRPLVHRIFLGADGWKDQGVNVDFNLPTSFYSKLSLSVLRGMIFETPEVTDDTLSGRHTHTPVFAGRLNVFTPVGDKGNMDAGVSLLLGQYKGRGATGTGDSTAGYRALNAAMEAVDAKYKIKWNDYTSLTVQGELMFSQRDYFSNRFERRSTWGGFGVADLHLGKRYNVGVSFERAPGIYDNGADDYEQNTAPGQINTSQAVFDTRNATTAATLFAGFGLLEETTLFRLAARWSSFSISAPGYLIDPTERSKRAELTIVAQLLFSIGPHKAHEF